MLRRNAARETLFGRPSITMIVRSIATNTTDLGDIITLLNAQSVNQIQLTSATLTYGCITAHSSIPTYSATPCSSGQTQETLVSYQVKSNVSLPLAMTLGLSNPYTLALF